MNETPLTKEIIARLKPGDILRDRVGILWQIDRIEDGQIYANRILLITTPDEYSIVTN